MASIYLNKKEYEMNNTKGLTILSYGGGQDSTAILVELIHNKEWIKRYLKGDFIVVMANTKNEHYHTNKYVNTVVRPLLSSRNIPFYHLDPKEWSTGSWCNGLVKFYESNNAVGSKAFPKTCTDKLKIQPIYKFVEYYVHTKYKTQNYGRKRGLYEFVERYGKINVLIGIARGEEKRISPNGSSSLKWFNECIHKCYPLIDFGLNRKDCQDTIENYGYEIPFPSNCILCPFMSEQELVWLYKYNNTWYNKWVLLERNKLNKNIDKGDKNLGVWGSVKTLDQILKRAINKYGHLTKTELEEYKFSHGHCVTSKY